MSTITLPKTYDVIVIGAGHAGCEAALAASRMGCETLLTTITIDSIAQMSCNPAIGGPGKGQLAREIDALGGDMAKAIDLAGIQFRMLNTKKGPAVWSPRAQADKCLYQSVMRSSLERQEGLEVKQLMVTGLVIKKGAVAGVVTDSGLKILGKTVVVAAGTFLNGVIHIGNATLSGGRMGEFSSVSLGQCLRELGFSMGRLKTGTSARLLSRSIDFSCFEPQLGDKNPSPFSYDTKSINIDQVKCYLGYTNKKTHKLIRDNLSRSPLYSGKIKGTGVRYCPSIEDKVVKFPEKDRHQIFLEPEGRKTCEIYVNGLSTSLPQDVQIKMLMTIDGLKKAQIMRFGYGIEYDYADPTQLLATLETKKVRNLYFAGQINGTTGYEEAACQGLIAGINAALRVKNKSPFVLDRTQAYIGVLIDDLTIKGTEEPYRLFTSRVEHRLVLRQDNADLRLSKYAFKLGLISRKKLATIKQKGKTISTELSKLNSLRHGNTTLAKLLKRPEMNYQKIAALDSRVAKVSEEIAAQIEIEIKYEGYIQREKSFIQRLKKLDDKIIPENFPYKQINGLKKEAMEKLDKIKPRSIGQAMRISGISSGDIALVLLRLE
ncbi:MAG: tRNA uridine-5-carboxymethylaminomethyl(34) synthesis enzyme MnmG [Candidatus Omnitrophica bacterium]|nr:tRNA uridine-5-carboxymethylaminomethyl(34) synthesis enzyme MnmG [Candidatus Omnitrophota bacterium]MBU4479688.1 tRNA uridine-5-carboxymethylaminomethyl(34) synthesis enzyme MnmG [Candidatus Omnitrophota bacterium]MCG2703112.1 tRNA uridine-5-carboxymethylaminomethyl(34) synthesis enzyme MnmG [Candidatus Omnitrophota bacterium]